jgi:glycosyltransferase involved in cell wall biosynthesis
MKKILFIHHACTWGGAPNSLIKLINSLDKSQYEVEVLLLKNSVIAEKLKESSIRFSVAKSLFYRKYYTYLTHSEADYIKWFQLLRVLKYGIIWILSRYLFAKQELANHEYDIVHLNSSVLTDWLAPAREFGKVILHVREPFRRGKCDLLGNILIKQIDRYADQIIAISKDNARRINLPSKTTVVYNFLNVESISEFSISDYTSKSVLYVGGSEYIKGFYTLVEALPYINDDITVYFSGPYSEILSNSDSGIKTQLKKKLKKIIFRKESVAFQKIRNCKHAKLIGLISDINIYIDKCVCLVSPFSVPHFSRPIIEAFGRRKPAIATKIEGIEEIIEDNRTGLLVQNENASDLANAINFICENPEIAKKIGDNGYKLAKCKFSQDNVKEICEVYANLYR